MITAFGLLIFPALMAFAAASDLLTMTISNRVSLGLIAGFFALAVIIGMSPVMVAAHVGAGLTVLTAGFVCFACGWIGGGDAKLAAAAALWLGFDQVFSYLVYASLLGGGLTLLILQFRLMPLPTVLLGQEWAERLHERGSGVPYGIALATAALMIYPDSAIMSAIGF